MTQIKWDASTVEKRVIGEIADRAMKFNAQYGWGRTKQDFLMDIEAVHCNDAKLDFERLRDADDFNFTHDIVGIARHLNRETGKLENHFLPRFRERTARR